MVQKQTDNEIDSTKHSCECRCTTCQKNKTGYFADWREETLQLQVATTTMTLQLTYFQDEAIPRTFSCSPGSIEISIVPDHSQK